MSTATDLYKPPSSVYICDWCGREVPTKTGRTTTVCSDCKHYEIYAETKQKGTTW